MKELPDIENIAGERLSRTSDVYRIMLAHYNNWFTKIKRGLDSKYILCLVNLEERRRNAVLLTQDFKILYGTYKETGNGFTITV